MINFLKRNRLEFLGGISTFATMAYIIIVNATILSATGMDEGSVMVATILSTAVATIMMGLISNLPIAIAPALSITPFLAYTVVLKNGFSWQQAMGAVFISSLILLILNMLNLRQKIVVSMPITLRYATTSGIGLFLILMGFLHIGIIKNNAVFISYGSLFTQNALFALLAALFIYVLLKFRIHAAYIIGLLVFWILAILFKMVTFDGVIGSIPQIKPTLFQMDISPLTSINYWSVIFSLLLISLIDTSASLICLCSFCGKMKGKKVPDLQPALFCDSIGSMFGAILGTGSLTFHLESAVGIQAGAKTGKAAIVTAICFIGCLFFYPLVKTIPEFATSAILIIIGLFMFKHVFALTWKKSEELIPSLLLILTMGLTLSIYDGISIGFLSYAFFKVLTKKIKETSPIFWVLSLIIFFHRLFLII